MSSDFDAPVGPASSVPPPPPATGQVPPASTPPPPPPVTPPPPPPPQPPPAPANPAVEAESPPPPPSAAAPSTDAQGGDDLADILAQLENEPAPSPDTPAGSAARHDDPHASPSAPATGGGKNLTDPRDLERPSRASGIIIESEGGIDFDPTFASFDKRALELIVDTAVLGLFLLPGLAIAVIAGSLWIVGVLVAMVGFVLFVGVAARSIAAGGQTVGNRVAGTRIVDGINGADIDVGRAALRVAARYLISMILFLGFLVAFTDDQRRTFHDRLARSIVTGRERAVWTADDETG